MGRETARRVKLSAGVQGALYEIKEWWNGGGNLHGLKGDQITLSARIAKVAADAALFYGLGGTPLALDALGHRAGGILDPSLVAELRAHPSSKHREPPGSPTASTL